MSRISRLSATSDNTPTTSLVVKQYTTFAEPGLLRAGQLVDVLKGGGFILRNSEGSADTYELSAGVPKIHSFISHNWSTPRYMKFAALAVHFNFNYAVLATCLALGFYVPLACLGYLPLIKMCKTHPVGISCRLIGSGVFLFNILMWHEVARWFGWRGPSVFLDKVCIHQTNEVLKRRGVESLAAFLCKSECLVIVYADTYFRKLWTVYELATFLTMHPTRPIVILSPALCKMFLLGSMIFLLRELSKSYVNMTFFRVFALSEHDDHTAHINRLCVWVLDTMPASLLLCWFLRRLARKHADMYMRAREFRIQTAMCFDESDRPLVHKNITAFMKHVGLIQPEATQGEALDAFNDLVHREMPRRMDYIMGWTGIPYRYVAAMNLPSACNCLDKVVYYYFRYDKNQFVHATTVSVVEKLGLTFALYPLLMALFALLTKRCLKLRGISDLIFVFFLAIYHGVLSVCIGYLQTKTRNKISDLEKDRAEPREWLTVQAPSLPQAQGLALYVIVCGSLFALALIAYRPGQSDAGCIGISLDQSPRSPRSRYSSADQRSERSLSLHGASPRRATSASSGRTEALELVSAGTSSVLLS